MSALISAGWRTHEIEDGGGQFQVLVRRSGRGAAHAAGVAWAPTAQDRSITGGGLDVPPVMERTGAVDSPVNPRKSARGHKTPMGPVSFDPDPAGHVAASVSAPTTAFGALPSVRAMGTGRPAMVVGVDTEFTTHGGVRVIDSYQFAVPDPLDPSVMVQVVILPLSQRRISLQTALWEVVKAAGLWRSPRVRNGVDDRGVRRDMVLSAAPAGKPGDAARAWIADPRDWQARVTALAPWRVPIVLAAHYGSADLTTFRRGAFVTDHLTRLTSAAGGLVTLLPFRLQAGDGRGDDLGWWQVMSITVRDTMAHAPAGQKSLAAIGAAAGIEKLEVPVGWISRMSDYRREHLVEFLEYGVNDAVIVVEYLARVWGDGVLPPVTLSGGAAASLVAAGTAHFGLSSPDDFRLAFAGLVDDDGVEVVEEDDMLSYYAKRGRVPVDGAAAQYSKAFASAYHGGLNSCPSPGYYPFRTVDIDAQNAYPTAMSLVRDLDWEAGVIDDVTHERYLAPGDVPEPTTPFVGFVSFTFPADVSFPCLPVVADGTLIYPRTSEGVAGTWVCGPELWLALQLGAEVFCQIGFVGREARCPDGSVSLALRHGVKQLIDDRNTAKELFGKGSIEELTLKTAVNSVYGKTAQDVAEQRAWNAHEQDMDAVGGSSITSPYHAAMSTSLVRAQLLATMSEIAERGGHIHSVTTDGFITDWEAAAVEALDLYGLADHLREARSALTGDPTIWEAKHEQDDLVNFTTRGNVSLSPAGVCAHNGLKRPAGVDEDSLEDRTHLLEVVVTRDGRVENPYTRFPSFRELSRKEDRRDFLPTTVNRAVSMDYDLKRRPVMPSMSARMVPLADGSLHEMATFDTCPWETIEDALRARRIARDLAQSGCLRTVDQWRGWHTRFAHGKGRRIVTPHRAVLMSLVMAHRQGVVKIPTLADRSLTVEQRLDWLARWGLGTVSLGDWKNARRPERASQMLPLDELEPYLSQMVAVPSGNAPGADATSPGGES